MVRRFSIVFILIGALFLFGACQHEILDITDIIDNGNGNPNPNPCDSNIVYFQKDILPILNSNCAMSGCHDGITAKEGVVLNSYANVMATGKVAPYYPNSSKIYKAISETNPKDIMPPAPKSKLTPAQIALVAKWINQGAKDITCNSAGNCDTTNITYAGTISRIVNTYCVGCHSGATPGAGILLNSYSGVAGIAASGRLVGSIKGLAAYKAMPVGSKLDDCKIKQIQKWVDAGYPNN